MPNIDMSSTNLANGMDSMKDDRESIGEKKAARIIVFGNEKGGSGKTTTAFHLCIALLRLGYSVMSLDLDIYQQSFTRYVKNRVRTASSMDHSAAILIPDHVAFDPRSSNENQHGIDMTTEKEAELLDQIIAKHSGEYDFILIDTPGAKTYLNAVVHSRADIVITPTNESFLDLDSIGEISTDFQLAKPGVYSEMIFAQRIKRAQLGLKQMDWVVVRNRISMLDAVNKRNVEVAIERLSKQLGFRVAPGFGDRVIFKELFLNGLTLYDAAITKAVKINTSLLAAKQEMREFIKALQLPEIDAVIDSN